MKRFRPELGQHFLTSPSVLKTILDTAGRDPAGTVMEIGPGRGVLTLPLAERFGAVIAVEKDARLAAALAAMLRENSISNVSLHTGDVLDLFPEKLGLPERYAVVANIPYYLTGRLLRTLLESPQRPARMTLLVQREVAERIIAKPPHANLLGLSVQTYGDPRIVARVSKTAFRPQPKVDSAIIAVEKISDAFFRKQSAPPEKFFELIRAGFSAKRKTLANALASWAGSKSEAQARLARAGIEPNARAQTLTLAQWAVLVR